MCWPVPGKDEEASVAEVRVDYRERTGDAVREAVGSETAEHASLWATVRHWLL